MDTAHMNLVNNRGRVSRGGDDGGRVDTAMEELIRRAKLQAGELSLIIQRLEQLRREIRQHMRSMGPA